MSIDTTEYDPFDASAEAPPADADGIDWSNVGEGDEFDDILAGMELEEEESGEEIRVRDAGKTYVDPRDVGLKDKMWVPIRILTAEVQDKHVPRLSSKTCIAKKDGKTFVLHEQVEAALRNGAEEIVAEVPLPYFICTANHASEQFGQRRFDWEIEVPVFTIKTALFKPQRNRTGYMNEYGRSLRQATGVTTPGDRISKDNMHEVADRMVEKIVMAQVSISQSKKPKFRDRLDENNNPINVLLDAETGNAVIVFSPEDGSGYVVEGSGEVYEGNPDLLVPMGDRRYAIRDNGDSSGVLKEEFYPVNDYINPPFLPVPERRVQVELLNGDTADGEITLDTVGVIARGKTPGFKVDVLLLKTGKKVTAVWLGTQWNEVESDGDALDEFKGGIESL